MPSKQECHHSNRVNKLLLPVPQCWVRAPLARKSARLARKFARSKSARARNARKKFRSVFARLGMCSKKVALELARLEFFMLEMLEMRSVLNTKNQLFLMNFLQFALSTSSKQSLAIIVQDDHFVNHFTEHFSPEYYQVLKIHIQKELN